MAHRAANNCAHAAGGDVAAAAHRDAHDTVTGDGYMQGMKWRGSSALPALAAATRCPILIIYGNSICLRSPPVIAGPVTSILIVVPLAATAAMTGGPGWLQWRTVRLIGLEAAKNEAVKSRKGSDGAIGKQRAFSSNAHVGVANGPYGRLAGPTPAELMAYA